MDDMTFRIFPFRSDDYDRSLVFRNAVLRIPLGQDLFAEDTGCDRHDFHIGMFDRDDEFAGILILTPLADGDVKMRQVGIREDLRGQGLGRRLVAKAEAVAVDRGFRRIVLNTRETAVPFYLAMGYEAEGDVFREIGIPHRKMKKALSFYKKTK